MTAEVSSGAHVNSKNKGQKHTATQNMKALAYVYEFGPGNKNEAEKVGKTPKSLTYIIRRAAKASSGTSTESPC